MAQVESTEQSSKVRNGKKEKKAQRAKPVLEPVSADGDSKFARALGSTDYQTREKGLQALTLWMCARADITEAEMLKIWKGLFFCFWHSDQAPVQDQLAQRLAGTLPKLNDKVGRKYFQTFMRTMRREWFGIDRLRLDKFLLLVRRFVRALFAHLRAGNWSADAVAAHATFLRDEVLLHSEAAPALGLSLHLADIALPELRAACEEGGAAAPVPWPALKTLLEAFSAALAATTRPPLVARLRDGVFGELAAAAGSARAFAALDMGALGADLFALGAREEVRARNREALYALSRTFERCAGKRARRSGAAERPMRQGLLNPAAPAEPLSDAGAPGTAGAEPDAGRRAPKGEAPPLPGDGQVVDAQRALHEFTLRPLDLRLVHAKQVAAEAPDLAPSAAVGQPAAGEVAGEAEAAVLPPKARPQRRRVDSGVAGPSTGGAAGKAVRWSKRKAAGADGAAGEAAASGVGGAAREAEAEQASAPAGGRDADAAALTSPTEALDEGAGGRPVAPAPKAGKKKRRAQAKAGGAAGAAGAAAGTALTGGAGGAPGVHCEPACATPAKGDGAAPASPAPGAAAPRNASGAEAPAAEAETPEGMKGAAGLASSGATAASAAAASKKRVKFALSRNLAHTFGAPAPPPAVRTPPGAQPKGSALKHGAEGSRVLSRVAGSAPGRLGGGGAGAPGARPGQSRLGGKPGGTVRRMAARSPKSLPRAQAAQFF